MRWTPLLATPAAIIVTAPAQATVYFTTEQVQHAIFPGASFTSTGSPGVWRASTGGYLVIDRVLGKHEYIAFALGVNANGTVRRIEIMTYNESYGYEVRNADWRAQFVGKSASSPLQLNADIKNISGATLSSKHITDGVRQILLNLKGRS